MLNTTLLRFGALVALTTMALTGALLPPEAAARPQPSDVAPPAPERFKDNGGSDESAAAVDRGLRWLALHQAPDGSWSLADFAKHGRTELGGKPLGCGCQGGGLAGEEVAGAAFGVLPFLGAGYTHKPGRGPNQKEYAKVVQGGLDYLLKKQDKEGKFGRSMYGHALATLAVCEAYALTSDAALKEPVQRALTFIAEAQYKAGGWRYVPREGDKGDLSVSGWQVAALASGRRAGLAVPKEALGRAEKFWATCEVRAEGDPGKSGKLAGYRYMAEIRPVKASPTLTAVGLLGRLEFGAGSDDRDVRDALATLKSTPPGKQGCYYEYQATQLMWRLGGDDWKRWNLGPDGKDGYRDLAVKAQDDGQVARRGHQLGSWDDANTHGGGRVMATSLRLLALEAPYEQLPVFRRGKDR
jgi:hypothetical protein